MRVLLNLILAFFALSGCAYRWGNANRGIPGGYRQVHIPIFKNSSMEPSVEVPFTNFLIQEFERTKVARVVDRNQAEVLVEGELTDVAISGEKIRTEGGQSTGFSQAQQYLITVNVRITLKRMSDQKVLSMTNYSRQRTYLAPVITQTGLTTMNPLYNQSAKRQNIEVIAKALMTEVHDRITDNF